VTAVLDHRPELGLALTPSGEALDRTDRLALFIERSGIGHVRLKLDGVVPDRLRAVLDRLAGACRVMPAVPLLPGAADPLDVLDQLLAERAGAFGAVELSLAETRKGDLATANLPALIRPALARLAERGKTVVLGLCLEDVALLDRLETGSVAAVALRRGDAAEPDGAAWRAGVTRARAQLDRSCGLWVADAGYATTRHDQGRQLAALVDALALPVERLYWRDYVDREPTLGGDGDDGLFRRDGRPKLAARLLEQGKAAGLAGAAPSFRLKAPVGAAKPIVITGGCGFIGANIADRFAGDAQTVLLLDNLERRGAVTNADWLRDKHGKRIVVAAGDVRDRELVRDVVGQAGAVLHLAAQVAVTTSISDPDTDFEVNARGTLNVLEALRAQHSPPALLFASTNKVYGPLVASQSLRIRQDRYVPDLERLQGGCDESWPLDLHSPYGCSKGAADQYVLDYARLFKLRAAVLRMSCVYGPRQHGDEDQGWVAHFVRAGLAGQPITIYGDGCQVRDVLFIDDAVEAWARALARVGRLAGRAFNLGGGPRNVVSLLDVLKLMRQLGGLRPKVRHAPWRHGDQLWYVSNTQAFEQATGWQAVTDPATGLARLLEWLTGGRLDPARGTAGLELAR
jgi:CDP-paratose 2-epimerase